MAGEARSNEFLLSTATLMIGPSAEVMELTPEKHSLGLVKNVQTSTEQQMTELTQGVQNLVVASVNTNMQTRISAEVYEYSARNLAYGAGLDASGPDYDPIEEQYALGAAIADGGVTVELAVGAGADFTAGDHVVIQDLNTPDRVHVGKVASIDSDTLTLAAAYAIPEGVSFAIATTAVFRVRAIGVGANMSNPTFGAKLVGLMPGTGEPVTLIFPKVRITKGINLAFQSDNWSNMPFEFTPYSLVPNDPFYADFGSRKLWKLFRR